MAQRIPFWRAHWARRVTTPSTFGPGAEIQSSGSLTIDSDWNLYSANRAGAEPGVLTLRAGGNLIVKSSISDGFETVIPRAALGVGPSWSYRLTAGADVSGANPLGTATSPDGHFILAPGQLIRTGTGNIDVAAAGDVRIGYDVATNGFNQPNASAAVIYTAGEKGPEIDPALFKVPPRQGPGPTPPTTHRRRRHQPRAGHDIASAPSKQMVADWLWRRGKTNPDGAITANQNTTWWVNFANFQQGVGALGGGNISVKAGNDINNSPQSFPPTDASRAKPARPRILPTSCYRAAATWLCSQLETSTVGCSRSTEARP